MGGSTGSGYSEGFSPTGKEEREPRGQLNPFSAGGFGAWYCLTCAAAMTVGTKYLSKTPGSHYIPESVAWVLGAGFGATLAATLARKWKIVAGSLSAIPSAAVWLPFLSLGSEELDTMIFGWSPSAFYFGVTFIGLNLLCGVVGSIFGAQAVTPNSLSEVVVSVRARHWWWLWIPAFAWVSMIPVVLYYVWLEIITTGYFAFHPWLWFNGSWDRDVAFGLMPGFMGIGALVYGIYLSLRSVIPPKDSETTKRRVTRFLAGTVLLVSIVSPFLLNWGISHLKDMPIVKGSTSWWIL